MVGFNVIQHAIRKPERPKNPRRPIERHEHHNPQPNLKSPEELFNAARQDGMLFTMDGCGHCIEMKKKLKDEIASGKVKVFKDDSPEAKKIANLDKLGYPTLFLVKRKPDGSIDELIQAF